MWDSYVVYGAVVTCISMVVSTLLLGGCTWLAWQGWSGAQTSLVGTDGQLHNVNPWEMPLLFCIPGLAW